MTETPANYTTAVSIAEKKVVVLRDLESLYSYRLSQAAAWAPIQNLRQDQIRLGFVPTMGALHQGHLELVKKAREKCQKVIVSIFVNPYQFAPHEDFSKYPRTFERDLELLQSVGADAVFYPDEKLIYPNGKEKITAVIPPSPLNDTLEGEFRPTFFRGVATVVLKLFNLVQPHIAFFGQKDYQQWKVIETMVKDLNLPVDIVGVPTVRERDGLAMSSRNAYLDEQARKEATNLYKALCTTRELMEGGKNPSQAAAEAAKLLQESQGWQLQYLKVCHSESLEAMPDQYSKPCVILAAAKLGEVRLIDNLPIAYFDGSSESNHSLDPSK